MANPFNTKFDSECEKCGSQVCEGELMYSISGDFLCEGCAKDSGALCSCGRFKRNDKKQCFQCFFSGLDEKAKMAVMKKLRKKTDG